LIDEIGDCFEGIKSVVLSWRFGIVGSDDG
jgi:hypothetical protein